ncbi:STAS domain-containing protein [Peribacillus saganii]|uniref:STAS domain-containing protein n=1 Tax=Peribacillus saganii TaxID=2303992 RepID=A0A372LMI6_9BACI|nr:STAS domain-containing protein [Peribacillus saganii]RFU68117.1 STAS domain-containing protein [Peribacillus saganii]
MDKNEEELLQEKIKELTQQVNELETLVQNVSVPIIPSIIPDTILIPVSGEVSVSRFDLVIPKILNYVNNVNIDSVILDFSAITLKEVENLVILVRYIESLTSSLKLMGIQVLIVGFTPLFAQELVRSELPFVKELNAFSSFKTALQFLMKEKGLAFTKVT